jgi:hypothetical protein
VPSWIAWDDDQPPHWDSLDKQPYDRLPDLPGREAFETLLAGWKGDNAFFREALCPSGDVSLPGTPALAEELARLPEDFPNTGSESAAARVSLGLILASILPWIEPKSAPAPPANVLALFTTAGRARSRTSAKRKTTKDSK